MPRKLRGKWGEWYFKGDTFVLMHGPYQYEFDFDRCRDSAGILDQIIQISTLGSHIINDRTFRDLVKGINAVLAPQENYCGSGKHRLANPRVVSRSRGYNNVAARKPAYAYGFGPKGGKAYRHETQ